MIAVCQLRKLRQHGNVFPRACFKLSHTRSFAALKGVHAWPCHELALPAQHACIRLQDSVKFCVRDTLFFMLGGLFRWSAFWMMECGCGHPSTNESLRDARYMCLPNQLVSCMQAVGKLAAQSVSLCAHVSPLSMSC